jgi:hypothetical protein
LGGEVTTAAGQHVVTHLFRHKQPRTKKEWSRARSPMVSAHREKHLAIYLCSMIEQQNHTQRRRRRC